MSRCYICDKVLSKPNWNKDHEDWDPCDECQEIIDNVFEDIPDPDEERLIDEDDIEVRKDLPWWFGLSLAKPLK